MCCPNKNKPSHNTPVHFRHANVRGLPSCIPGAENACLGCGVFCLHLVVKLVTCCWMRLEQCPLMLSHTHTQHTNTHSNAHTEAEKRAVNLSLPMAWMCPCPVGYAPVWTKRRLGPVCVCVCLMCVCV